MKKLIIFNIFVQKYKFTSGLSNFIETEIALLSKNASSCC